MRDKIEIVPSKTPSEAGWGWLTENTVIIVTIVSCLLFVVAVHLLAMRAKRYKSAVTDIREWLTMEPWGKFVGFMLFALPVVALFSWLLRDVDFGNLWESLTSDELSEEIKRKKNEGATTPRP